ncbi:hypothetical protein RCL_jg23976.t1 [Rhizophagus clarus]|uniref:Uncharacterized protein n=1 Tax=Rhizophagus clarus TaxID=94130 RepID=A0A8H3LLW6_9GLOM|nr:hypothetical protein RCL_jg23976.t1 [Rhizophagus clarus]
MILQKRIPVSINELLETSDDNLSQDKSQVSENNSINFRCKPLTPITSIKNINTLRNYTLDNYSDVDSQLENDNTSHP